MRLCSSEELIVIDHGLTPFMIVRVGTSEADSGPNLVFTLVFLENHEKKEAEYVFEALSE